MTRMATGVSDDEDDDQDWRSPASLLDSIEGLLSKMARSAIWMPVTLEDGSKDHALYAYVDVDDIDVLGTGYFRWLRAALRDAGLDVPERGEWDRLVEEEPWEPPPLPERGPILTAILAEASRRREQRDSRPDEPSAVVEVPAVVAVSVAMDDSIRETALYRWWDEDDALLYVGISDHLDSRTRGHAMGSSWMEFAVRSAIERHPSRRAALDAEEAAIKAEQPLFNDVHNRGPEAQQRLVEYLIKRGRLDLLAPAVSRG